MKKLMLSLVLSFVSINLSFASTPCVVNEIQQKFHVDISHVDLDQCQEEFVEVEFRIIEGEINILKINGTQTVLEDIVIDELREMQIESSCSPAVIHRYKFTFEKI